MDVSISNLCPCTHRFITKWVILLHAYLVSKYITWHNHNHWLRLSGKYTQWLNVVAILDCTPFRICKPKSNEMTITFPICMFLVNTFYLIAHCQYTFSTSRHMRHKFTDRQIKIFQTWTIFH